MEGASETVVKDIVMGLYEKRYVPGQRLIETDLVETYGVSRTTVREAVRRLSVQGVVEINHNRGARIRTIGKTEARSMLLITEVIVGLAARLAAENIDEPGSRELMCHTLDSIVEPAAATQEYDFVRRRNNFHRTLARVGKSFEIENILSNLQVHLVRNQLVMQPEQRAKNYTKIVNKVLDGDAKGAEAAARKHVQEMLEMLGECTESQQDQSRDVGL
jgi:DNA-binding GntR family transcriptional regulator